MTPLTLVLISQRLLTSKGLEAEELLDEMWLRTEGGGGDDDHGWQVGDGWEMDDVEDTGGGGEEEEDRYVNVTSFVMNQETDDDGGGGGGDDDDVDDDDDDDGNGTPLSPLAGAADAAIRRPSPPRRGGLRVPALPEGKSGELATAEVNESYLLDKAMATAK
jgi:hypothetical protein